MTILIQGEIGVGKSTLIRKILETRSEPLYGFFTKREPNGDGGFSVYIHHAQGEWQYTEENLVGLGRPGQGKQARPEAFERAAGWLENIPAKAIVVMDELGVMEENAPRFQKAVLDLLQPSERLVLAAVKSADGPFLNRVRQSPGAVLVQIDRKNRDEMTQGLLSACLKW